MTLVNPLTWIQRAQREHFAIGAFNANTLEQVQAIVIAAQAENAPAIIQVSHRALQHAGSGNSTLGLRYMAAIGTIAAQSVAVPIGLHLDHASENEAAEAIALGFTSVMFDGGELRFAQNIEQTIKVRDIAHAAGVCLEAEVGEVPRADSRGRVNGEAILTSPAAAAEFVKATGVDLLAVALGSVHAIKRKEVPIDLDRLQAIRSAVDVPLVLHGSSGVTDEHIAKGIKLGLCKVNVATQFSQAFTASVRATLAADPQEVDPRRYLGPAREAMTARARERIQLFCASGKAV